MVLVGPKKPIVYICSTNVYRSISLSRSEYWQLNICYFAKWFKLMRKTNSIQRNRLFGEKNSLIYVRIYIYIRVCVYSDVLFLRFINHSFACIRYQPIYHAHTGYCAQKKIAIKLTLTWLKNTTKYIHTWFCICVRFRIKIKCFSNGENPFTIFKNHFILCVCWLISIFNPRKCERLWLCKIPPARTLLIIINILFDT